MDSPLRSLFTLPRLGFVKVRRNEKSYQLRIEQLTIQNICKIFNNLIPDTVLLVSSHGTVALPDDLGHFCDVDEWREDDDWEVQGTEARPETSKRISPSPLLGTTSAGNIATNKWRPSFSPSVFPPRASSSKRPISVRNSSSILHV